MKVSKRIGALDIAEAISDDLGSFVSMENMQFLAVEDDRIRLWYVNGWTGPCYDISLIREGGGWRLTIEQHPPGTEQEIEVP